MAQGIAPKKIQFESYRPQILNFLFRGVTLGIKFSLVFALAVFLTPVEMGLYGLIGASIAYGMYPLGFDFFAYNIREILSADSAQRGAFLKNQAALHLKLYLLFLPIFILIFVFDYLPWKYSGIFFVLLILEHINLELIRLMNALSKQLEASVCLFIRQAGWVIVAVAYMYLFIDARNLLTILYLWSIGSFVAMLIGLSVIHNMKMGGWTTSVDWKWIRRGLWVSVPFLIASLSLNTIATVDRYWMSFLAGKEILAAYVFFTALCSSLLSFLDAAIFSFTYPKLISAVIQKDQALFRQVIRKMAIQTAGLIVAFFVCSLVVIEPILNYLGNDVYRDNINLFYIALVAIGIHTFSYVFHYFLYAHKRDRSIVFGHFGGLILFVLCCLLFSQFSSVYAVPYAVLCGYTFILLWKGIACYLLRGEQGAVS